MSAECDMNVCDSAENEASRNKAGMKEWIGLSILALPTILLGLDVTILYLALPALSLELQPSSTQALWIMDVYGFMIAGFLITMGSLGDRIGRRRLLMIGATAFAGASVLAAYAPNAEMLIVARALLGIAGATLMPSTLALSSNMFFDARQRALAIGIWATMFALGMALGPVVGGVLLEEFWWGAAFLIAVPIVAILLVCAPLLLPEYSDSQAGRLDLGSVLLLLTAILPGIYAIKEISKAGLSPSVPLFFGIAVVGTIFFVRRQQRLADPLLDLHLFSNRTFVAALLILLVGLTGVAGMMLLVTQYLQLVAGYSPFRAGLWMGPPALMMVLAGIFSPVLARYIRPAFVIALALTISGIGCGLIAFLNPLEVQVLSVVAGFSMVYLGLGTIAAIGTDLVVGAAPTTKAGSASAMSEMVQELGVALGVALLGSLTTLLYRVEVEKMIPDGISNELAEAFGESLWATMEVAEQFPAEILSDAQFAFTRGMTVAAAVSAVIILALAMLSVVGLRHVKTVG